MNSRLFFKSTLKLCLKLDYMYIISLYNGFHTKPRKTSNAIRPGNRPEISVASDRGYMKSSLIFSPNASEAYFTSFLHAYPCSLLISSIHGRSHLVHEV